MVGLICIIMVGFLLYHDGLLCYWFFNTLLEHYFTGLIHYVFWFIHFLFPQHSGLKTSIWFINQVFWFIHKFLYIRMECDAGSWHVKYVFRTCFCYMYHMFSGLYASFYLNTIRKTTSFRTQYTITWYNYGHL